MWRQGDLLFMEVNVSAEKIEQMNLANRDGKGRIVLAEGETTGHAHAVLEAPVKMHWFGQSRYLTSPEPFTVVHEEHAPVNLPGGKVIQVIRQTEFDPLEMRTILD